MLLLSTRNTDIKIDSLSAVIKGISDTGGLFVPQSFSKLSKDEIESFKNMNFCEISANILHEFFDELTLSELKEITSQAYSSFESEHTAPVVKLNEREFVLELTHGPTLAFKDIALTLLSRLLLLAKQKDNISDTTLILVATSGDTGKAALSGFRDVEKTKIVVFYPQDGVSDLQKLQMVTQEGSNTFVCGVNGNFDDAQTGVKNIFADTEFANSLKKKNIALSSANSINFGRLAPQIAYYFSAYVDLLNKNEIAPGEKVNFVVPTGNFGNILAAYYAYKMGLPVNKLICASNKNNVLTDFFATGVYNKNREFYKTSSPSMDILISSNLERLLFEILNHDADKLNALMQNLASNGEYCLDNNALALLQEKFAWGFADETATNDMIAKTFKEYKYLADPHTAVALSVYKDYAKKTNDTAKTVIVSTASPYKFGSDVLSALNERADGDVFDVLEKLSKLTGTQIPQNIKRLKSKQVLHNDNVNPKNMINYISKVIEK